MTRRHILMGIAAWPMAVCCAGPVQAQGLNVADLAGNWAGQGRFFDVALRDRHGPVPFEFQIDAAGVLSGRMGQARIPASPPRRVRDRLHYQAVLEGPVGTDAAFERRHLVLIVGLMDGQVLDVDFHLKRWFGLDLAMNVGNVQARRQL